MNILFSANVAHTGLAIIEVINEIKKFIDIKVRYISFHKWYGIREKSFFESVIFEKFVLNNPNQDNQEWWSNSNNTNIFFNNLRIIEEELDLYINDFNPDILITADDQGYLEKLLMKKCEEKGIKVFLLEHGFGYVTKKLTTNWVNTLKRIYSDFRTRQKIKNYFPILPFGMNNCNSIFCYSDFTYFEYKKNKFLSSKINLTGYPYFDLVHNYLINHPYNKKISKGKSTKKILIISSGYNIFDKSAYSFSIVLTPIIKYFSKQDFYAFEYYIRPKLGEDIDNYQKIIKKFSQLGISVKLEDTTNISFHTLNNFDLVIGESSTLLLEAILFRIPIILVENKKTKLQKKYDEILIKNKLFPIVIDNNSINFNIDFAFSEEYRNKLYSNLFKNEKYYFHKFDGKSSKRIAEIIINRN